MTMPSLSEQCIIMRMFKKKIMKKLYNMFLFSSFIFFTACFFIQYSDQAKDRTSTPSIENLPLKSLNKDSKEEKITKEFAQILEESPSEKKYKVLIDFDEQLDLVKYSKILRKENLSKIQRREAVIKALYLISERTEKDIKDLIDSFLAQGDIDYFKKISIINRLYIVGNAKSILEFAKRKDVSRIIQEYSPLSTRMGQQHKKEVEILSQRDIKDNWVIKMMGADIAWEMGYDGTGVTIGIIDTGVWYQHEQLKKNFKSGENSWYDPVSGSIKPIDSKSHGTGVISCAAGTNENNRNIGIAKGAKWIAALANHRNTYSNIYMTLSADWILNIGKPDVIVNAWSHGRKKCYAFDLDFINAWKAAEMFPVFAAGNSGPSKSSSESPADLAETFPDGSPVFSVGSINSEGLVSSFSSRGPSRCSHQIFPTVVAPGEDVFFAFPTKEDAYIGYSGTSSATGFAAGAIALLIQKFPEMSVDEMEKLIKERAIDKGIKGPDNDYGFGLIYLPAIIAEGY